MLDERRKDAVEYCNKTLNFKLKLTMSTLPPDVGRALKGCTKETVSSFAGVKTRFRIMSASLLPQNLSMELKSLGLSYNFTDTVSRMLDEKKMWREKLGQEFYQQMKR